MDFLKDLFYELEELQFLTSLTLNLKSNNLGINPNNIKDLGLAINSLP